MVTRNLRPFQYQIDDLVFGKYTPYPVLGAKPQSYETNNQDYQISQSNEIQFGKDTLKAGTIIFKIGVRDNAPVKYLANSLPGDLVEKSSKLLEAFHSEWKADDIRQQFGEVLPIIFCDGYGSVRRVYGRPRKFDYSRKTEMSSFNVVTCEFQRVDTQTYTDTEYFVSLVNGADPVFHTRDGGRAQAWYRIILFGPQAAGATVDVGVDNFVYNEDILAGDFVEISSYPWQRRVVDSNGINKRRKLIGNTKYLNVPKLPPNTSIPMSWSASLTSGDSACLVLWRDAYHIF